MGRCWRFFKGIRPETTRRKAGPRRAASGSPIPDRCEPLLRAEAGKSLPAALITLAVGSLLLTPFLSFVSARSLGTTSAEAAISSQYSSDGGLEFGIWSLLYNSSFRAQADSNVSLPQALAFPGTLNGYAPTISVTALPIGSWTIRQSAPNAIDNGGSLAYAGGNRVYSLRGDNTRSFGYYDIATDTWHSLSDAPGNVERGGALIYGGGNFLYALQGGNNTGFWRYNTTNNNWASMQDTPNRVRQGGDLVYAGGDHIYALRGNSTTFWRYSIASDSWSDRANTPSGVSFGSDLAYTGGSAIYALQGGNQSSFWRYNISSDSWSSLQDTPGRVIDGGGLAYHSGNYIYALRGNSSDFWRYTIATNSWSVLTSAPANVNRGSDLVFTTSTIGFASRGGGTTDFWEFVVTPPRYDIQAAAGSVTTDCRVEISGTAVSVLFWDIH